MEQKFFSVDSLIKNVRKQESLLSQLERKGANSTVITAQEEMVNQAKDKLEAVKNDPTKKAIQAKATDDPVIFCVVKGQETEKVSKKLAFVKNNRPIDSKRVDKFICLIAQGKYEQAYPIIVAEAEKLIEKGYTIVDVNGNEINKEDAKDYLVILDGQHKGSAFAKLIAAGEQYEIPNVHIRDKENIGEYLVEINEASKSWDNKDKFAVAGLTTSEEVFVTISEKIGEGFNPSTAALIYTGKKTSVSCVNKVLKGKNAKLPKGAVFNKERGDKFITLCKAAGMEVALITKRYYIKGVNSFAASTSEKIAFNALKEIGNTSNLDEIKAVRDEDAFIKLLREGAQQVISKTELR